MVFPESQYDCRYWYSNIFLQERRHYVPPPFIFIEMLSLFDYVSMCTVTTVFIFGLIRHEKGSGVIRYIEVARIQNQL